jgi:hypothetical protein
VNSDSGSGRRAGQLQIYGDYSGLDTRTLRTNGSSIVCAAFYGPKYSVALSGDTDWSGSIVSRSFTASGGDGNGGVHYDEALAIIGPPVSYRIIRYAEDVRE